MRRNRRRLPIRSHGTWPRSTALRSAPADIPSICAARLTSMSSSSKAVRSSSRTASVTMLLRSVRTSGVPSHAVKSAVRSITASGPPPYGSGCRYGVPRRMWAYERICGAVDGYGVASTMDAFAAKRGASGIRRRSRPRRRLRQPHRNGQVLRSSMACTSPARQWTRRGRGHGPPSPWCGTPHAASHPWRPIRGDESRHPGLGVRRLDDPEAGNRDHRRGRRSSRAPDELVGPSEHAVGHEYRPVDLVEEPVGRAGGEVRHSPRSRRSASPSPLFVSISMLRQTWRAGIAGDRHPDKTAS